MGLAKVQGNFGLSLQSPNQPISLNTKKNPFSEQGGEKSRREVTKLPFFSKPHPATKTKKVAKLPVFPKPHTATKAKKVAKLPVFSKPHSATKSKKKPKKRCIYAKGFKFCRSLDHKRKV